MHANKTMSKYLMPRSDQLKTLSIPITFSAFLLLLSNLVFSHASKMYLYLSTYFIYRPILNYKTYT